MYLNLKWVSLGLFALSCITRGQKSSLDEDGKLVKKLGLINERIDNLEASLGKFNERPLAGLTHHKGLPFQKLKKKDSGLPQQGILLISAKQLKLRTYYAMSSLLAKYFLGNYRLLNLINYMMSTSLS